jgi:hypothetical protein
MMGDANSLESLRQCTETLSAVTTTFASRRMDESINKALSGRQIESINL